MAVKTFACIRADINDQAVVSQRCDIRDYAEANDISIDEFIELEQPSGKSDAKALQDSLLENLNEGDTLIVSELSRLGRSIAQVINIVNALISEQVNFIAVKQDMVVSGRHDPSTMAVKDMFTLFSQLDKDLISERTRQGLEARRAAGIKLGRPKGSTGKSKLDPHKEQVVFMLKHKAPLSYIARVYGVTWPTVANFIKTRNLEHYLNGT